MRVIGALRRVAADLAEVHRGIALVGGLAVSARAEPRFTRDMDFAVSVADDREAEHVVFLLRERGYRVRAVLENQLTGRLATVRLLPPHHEDEDALTDLLFGSLGIEAEVVAGATPLDVLPGMSLPVSSIGHLIAMKLLSHDAERRPRDAEDLLSLLQIASADHLGETRTAIRLITERNFHRGKDLTAELASFLRRAKR